MQMQNLWKMAMLVGLVVSFAAAAGPPNVWGAEQPKPPKKEKKATPSGKSQGKTFPSGSIKASGGAEVAKANACFGEVPKIETLAPDEGKVGDKVKITGKGFGAPGCRTSVSFGPGHAAKFEQKGETEITATVPSGGRKGLAILSVTTSSGEDSKPFLVK